MQDLPDGLSLSLPASREAIEKLEKALDESLPSDYLEFLTISDGAVGPIGDSGYIVLWNVSEVHSRNVRLEEDAYAPGFLLFGSDGGGEAFGFDTRKFPYGVVMVPFIVMSWEDALPFGDSFTDFLGRLNRGEWPL